MSKVNKKNSCLIWVESVNYMDKKSAHSVHIDEALLGTWLQNDNIRQIKIYGNKQHEGGLKLQQRQRERQKQ